MKTVWVSLKVLDDLSSFCSPSGDMLTRLTTALVLVLYLVACDVA